MINSLHFKTGCAQLTIVHQNRRIIAGSQTDVTARQHITGILNISLRRKLQFIVPQTNVYTDILIHGRFPLDVAGWKSSDGISHGSLTTIKRIVQCMVIVAQSRNISIKTYVLITQSTVAQTEFKHGNSFFQIFPKWFISNVPTQ